MFRGRIFVLVVIVLLIIGSLSMGGYAGWSQGYAMGLAASSEGGVAAPHMSYGFGFFPFFWGIGLFFKMGLLFLLFLMAAKFFGFWAWRMAGGPPGAHWGRHKHWHHGPRPPWRSDWEEASEEKAGQDEIDKQTGNA